MSYQINIHNNTSVYVNKNDDAAMFSKTAGKTQTDGSTMACTEADEGLLQVLNDEEASQLASTRVMKNTEQYMELLEKQGAVSEDEDAVSEEEAKERKKEIYRNLSSEEIAKLQMMQVDLSTTSLSDIAGLVASIRSEAHRQELKQQIADICDGVDATRKKVIQEDIRETLGKLLPEEMESLVIDNVFTRNDQITEQQTVYLLKNELPLTISNLYKSEYATVPVEEYSENTLADEELEALMPQIETVIESAGITDGDMSGKDKLAAAAFMIQHDILITPDAIRNYAAIQNINEEGIDLDVLAVNLLTRQQEGQPLSDANVYYNEKETAKHLQQMTFEISSEALHQAKQQEMAVTIQNLDQITEYVPEDIVTEEMSRAELTARRQLEEIRLSMTEDAALRLVMKDIHIDTKELSEVVKKLTELEQAMAKETLADYDVASSEENVSLYQETMHKVSGLRQMPAQTLNIVFQSEPLTINSLYEEGMKQALRSYETMMTTPRSDMGDSMAKAFNNADLLLQEMGLTSEEENLRAVKILGYNQMEITQSTLSMIKEADAKVNQMLQAMTPQAVLDLIRNRQNPLEMSVDELNEVLAQNAGDEAIVSDERYSRFLYKLERRQDISEEEKESFIGIYRLLDKIQKGSGRDIGFVVKAGETLTLKNLLSAHRSRQAQGMDVSISDENGALESAERKNASISEQIERAFQTYDQSPAMQVFDELLSDMPDSYAQEIYEQNQYMEFSNAAELFASENDIAYTQGNLAAIDRMLSNEAGIYGMIRTWLDEKTPSKERDEETTTEETLDEMFSQVEASVTDADTAGECYDALSESLTEISYEGVLTYQDIQSLKQIHTGISILNKMAEKEHYQVPLLVDGAWTVLNVHFVNEKNEDGGEDTGAISITMEHPDYGYVTADITTGADADGQIETEHAGIISWPEDVCEQAKQALTVKDRYALAKDLFRVLSAM